jgi:alpha-L-fucosidase 2
MTDTNHHFFLKAALAGLAILSSLTAQAQPEEKHNLHFEKLAKVWDEALPLGNGTVGALIWERQGKLRLSLDRADIWDMRPMAGLHRDEFSYKWVQGQVRKKDYKPVQQYFDAPYDREPAPSKIPAGALEFTLPAGLEVKRADVMLASASAVVEWSNGMVLKTFVHATKPAGWFRFEHVSENLVPELVAPRVQRGGQGRGRSQLARGG